MIKEWLQDVPAEIRLKVYESLFESMIVLMHDPNSIAHRTACSQTQSSTATNLFLTSRTVRDEAEALLLKKATFGPQKCLSTQDEPLNYFKDISLPMLSIGLKVGDIQKVLNEYSQMDCNGISVPPHIAKFSNAFQTCKITNNPGAFRPHGGAPRTFVGKLINLGWDHRVEVRSSVRRVLPIRGFVSTENEDLPRVSTCLIHSKADRKICIYGKSMDECRLVQDWLLESIVQSSVDPSHNAEVQLVVET